MRDVYIVAVGMIPFAKYEDKGIKDLTKMVTTNLLNHSPVEKKELEAAWFGNAGWGIQTGQHCIRGQVALSAVGIGGIPVMNVENACAGGSSAFHGAWMGVASGAYDVALALGVEQTMVPKKGDAEARQKGFSSFLAGTDVEVTTKMIEMMQKQAEQKRAQLEKEGKIKKGEGGKERSPFMDIYAMAARNHMKTYGTTEKQLAVIAAKNHNHGALNPDAQYKFEMTPEEVLDDRLVAWPLTRSMCAPTGDGAAAAIVVSGDYLKKLTDARPVKVRASVVRSGGSPLRKEMPSPAQQAYDIAGVGPEDIDTAEVHDATAFGELSNTESLGFCKVGEGGPYAESGATTLGGERPINPSGGLECRGHHIGATGLAQIAEIVYQLRGQAGKRQVADARIGLTQNAGGTIGAGEAAIAIHILEGPTT